MKTERNTKINEIFLVLTGPFLGWLEIPGDVAVPIVIDGDAEVAAIDGREQIATTGGDTITHDGDALDLTL